MHARHRAAIIAGILALGAFILRWPLENHICNPDTWGYTNEKGAWVSFRPPRSEGENFFNVVFRGGSGTPAIFAMLGGQRYVVANIIWNYADVLFHKGKPFKMPDAFESVVTLNPSFTEAWSVYGWHLAWNLYAYVENDDALRAKWLEKGEQVYQRAIVSNPKKPRPYFDLAWLLMQRKGDYEGAIKPLETVVYGQAEFKPITSKELKNKKSDPDIILERRWLPNVYANRLGYSYKKLALIRNDMGLMKKAIETYKLGYKLDPEANTVALTNARDLEQNLNNPQWWKEQLEQEQQNRERFGMSPTSQFYDTSEGHDDHDHE
ncbi:MAG: tetratricopeptide repeat protein [Armatimonadota bacterium]